MLRRAVLVSGARQFNPPPGLRAADPGSNRLGVCFNYQMPQAEHSTRTVNWLNDFSAGGEPLAGFDAGVAFGPHGAP
jgi:transcriptional regulator GlxA family with amidase domain